MDKRYVITTPIYYVNAAPHIGTALTTLASDVTARYHRLRGAKTFFLTGTDENGIKVMEAAERAGKTTREFVDELSAEFRRIFDGMGIAYDDFIRTTEERHTRTVVAFFEKLKESGHIYLGKYEGWYDVGSETFFKESELVDGKSPDGNEVRWVEEDNYFFKLSAFEKPLLDHLQWHPRFILPEPRRNEVAAFIRSGLRDTCITRTNHGWGVPVPGEPDKVIYVWFDALINYVSATGWPEPGWEERWPADVQWMGKDILTRFHATLWPAMLMAMDLPLPHTLMGHAWMLMGGEKISKSRGNVVPPLELAAELAERSGCAYDLAVDAVRYFMAAAMPCESDTTFTHDEFDRRYNADLANDLGNALNRSLSMAHKFTGGVVPDSPVELEAQAAIRQAKEGFETAMEDFRVHEAAESALALVRFLNKYIDRRAPWALAKAQDPAVGSVIRSMLLCLRAVEGLIRPILPSTADAIARQLGVAPTANWKEIGTQSSLPTKTALMIPEPMFPRLELATRRPEMKTPAPTEEPKTDDAQIGIDEFKKVQLRVARILEAEPLEGSDKLMRLQVIVDGAKRQIVAGIRKNYDPLDLIGRQIVVVANLKPAVVRGAESQGMLLAAVDEDGGAILLQPDRETPESAVVR